MSVEYIVRNQSQGMRGAASNCGVCCVRPSPNAESDKETGGNINIGREQAGRAYMNQGAGI
jgi:hypothetical protein